MELRAEIKELLGEMRGQKPVFCRRCGRKLVLETRGGQYDPYTGHQLSRKMSLCCPSRQQLHTYIKWTE